MQKQIKYYSCTVCKRQYRAKHGVFTNEGFRCIKHSKIKMMSVKGYECKVCHKKVIKDIIIDGVCDTCTPLPKSKWSK